MTYSSKKKVQSNNKVEENYFEGIPRIWTRNPSYKDINIVLSIVRMSFIILIFSFIIISTYILTSNYFTSIILGVCTIILFFIIFHEQFFCLSYLLPGIIKKIRTFDPFRDFYFWYNSNDPTLLYYSNKNDLSHTGIKIFKINIIPDNVHEVINHFIKSLSHKDLMINFTYQIVHNPIININNGKIESSNKESDDLYSTSIYFCIYQVKRGILVRLRNYNLVYNLNKYSKILKGTFVADFHHFNIITLSGSELIKAIQVFFLNGVNSPNINDNGMNSKKEFKIFKTLKFLFIFYLILYIDFLLITFKLNGIHILILDITLLLFFIFLIWREVLFSPFYKKKGLIRVEPFRNIKFYYFKKIHYSIFLHVGNILLINFKLFNLKHSLSPFFSYPNKFVQAILYHKIPFSYTLINSPLTYKKFSKEGFEYLNEKTMYSMTQSNWKIKNESDQVQWLSMRSGIWKTILNISLFNYKITDRIDKEDLLLLDEQLILNTDVVHNLFVSNFQNFELILLKKRKLISGLLCEILKNKNFRLGGTHLNYLIFQGKLLNKLVETADEYKKGVKTRIGAEFNTPLYLENLITFGHTLNTEVLEKEVPVGLTYEQIKNVLITNGTSIDREILSMKIVSEGIKKGISFLVFDFTGNWSRLINQFTNTDFEKEILYFKLGSTFILNPKYSDIDFDNNNFEYLNYMLDAFAIAFKKNDREIDILRERINQTPDLTLGKMDNNIPTQNNYRRSYSDDTLTSLISNFNQNYSAFFYTKPEHAKNEIYPYHFIESDKTVIIDLSISRDISTQLFLAFLVISKIIHYIYYSDNYDAKEKNIVIPNIDAFFDQQRYSYYKLTYGRIQKFLSPLIKYNFGLIFSSNQVYEIHSSVLKYFNNIITFKATDNRDMAALGNIMNLQELVGKGVYSNYRNQTYQLSFLKTMVEDEIIFKRSDIHQPFSAIVEADDIKNLQLISQNELIDYMKEQGYDLKNIMQQILKEVKKTLFDKDLGKYSRYLKEIIAFLDNLRTFNGIGNSYEGKIKEELLHYIAPKAIDKGISKENIKKLRNSIFETLTKHKYLKEDYSRTAGGSESLRTSYSVGSQYQKALDDYSETKGDLPKNVSIELINQESNTLSDNRNIFISDGEPKESLTNDLKRAFEKNLSRLNYNIFTIYRNINQGKFKEAFDKEQMLLENFIKKVYREYYNTEDSITSSDLEKFYLHLSNDNEFPIDSKDLAEFIDYPSTLDKSEKNLEMKVKRIYNYLHKFFKKIKDYI